MSETLQKGWLTTRDGQKYAPATLVENVYTRSGKPYDQRVREYIQGLKNTSDTTTATLQATVKSNSEKIADLQNNTAYFNGEASDALYIVDSEDNVIAYIDDTGVNSIDFTIPNSVSLSGVKQSITTINNTLATLQADIDAYENIDASDNDQLFIIDSQENVIAYINHEGVHSVNFLVDDKGSMDYLTAIGKLTTCIADLDIAEQNIDDLDAAIEGVKADVDNRLQNFSGNEDGNALFIIDSQENVIAQIDADGIHTTQVSVTEGIESHGEKALYITDVNNNVIAYVDELGVHSIDFLINSESGLIYPLKQTIENLLKADENINTQLASLLAAINKEITDRETAISEVKDLITEETTNRGEAIESLKTELTKKIDDADEALSAEISKVNEALDARIDIVEDKTTNLHSNENNESLYIIDKDENVVAYIDSTGVHSIDFFIDEQDKKTVYAIKETLANLIQADVDINALITKVDSRVEAEEGTRANEISRVEGLISDEATARDEAVQSLNTALSAKIQEEADARAAKDTEITAYIDKKNSERVEAEDALSDRADALAERATALETKTVNLDSSQYTDSLFIIDKDENVVAYIDGSGLHAIDVFVDDRGDNGNVNVADLRNIKGRVVDLEDWRISAIASIDNHGERISIQESITGETAAPAKTHKKRLDDLESYVGTSGSSTSSLNNRLTTIETLVGKKEDATNVDSHEGRIKSHAAAISAIEGRLENVTNVMDFRGAYAELPEIVVIDGVQNFQNGDVIVITSGDDKGKEFVCDTDHWVEFGNSDATSTAIANLQAVTGHSNGLNTGETNHHDWLVNHESRITTQEARTTAVKLTDDDVVILTGSGGQDIVTLDAKHKSFNAAGSYTKVTTDAYGHVTSGSNPNTLSGMGITDGVTQTSFAAYQAEIDTWKTNLENNLNFEFDDRLYIVDNAKNVIGYFDGDGLTITNINIKTPVVPSGSTANTTGQSTATMMFFETTGTVTIPDTL